MLTYSPIELNSKLLNVSFDFFKREDLNVDMYICKTVRTVRPTNVNNRSKGEFFIKFLQNFLETDTHCARQIERERKRERERERDADSKKER